MASGAPPLDPRVAAWTPNEDGAEAGVRPVVTLPRSGLPTGVIIALIVAAAILLFIVLDSRRRAQIQPAVKAIGSDAARLTAPPPPPLYIPPLVRQSGPVIVQPALQTPPPQLQAPAISPAPPNYGPAISPEIRYLPPPPEAMNLLPPPPQRVSNGQTVVIDTTTARAAGSGADTAAQPSDGQSLAAAVPGANQGGGRVRASAFANRSTTVALGTLIPVVLETAFDSRRPGFARAIVSRDVRGFDGSRVLIPRGSRLTGEYLADIKEGQKRALINWTRLIRPDGVTIAINSPTADTLGRGGVRGNYNSHFFERFGAAILQSVLQVGVNLASREAAGNVIVALPGSTQNTPALTESSRAVPTLTVPAGTSISVFVARDLDFSTADRAQ